MPQFTVKTKYIEKLKQLGVYDHWLTNVEADHVRWDRENKIEKDYNDFNYFIQWSFEWSRAPEGQKFWSKITDS